MKTAALNDTKTRILDAAERLFAERGFDASLRAITGAAGVNLAAVNYHFRTKEALVRAVFTRRLEPLNRERLALLDAYENEAGGGPVALEKLLGAMLNPVVRLGRDNPRAGRSFKMLMGRMYSEPSLDIQRIFGDEIDEVVARFCRTLQRALPELSQAELYWRIFFIIGGMAFVLSAGTLLESISGGRCDPLDVEGAVSRLMVFAVSGLQAPSTSKRIREKGKHA